MADPDRSRPGEPSVVFARQRPPRREAFVLTAAHVARPRATALTSLGRLNAALFRQSVVFRRSDLAGGAARGCLVVFFVDLFVSFLARRQFACLRHPVVALDAPG